MEKFNGSKNRDRQCDCDSVTQTIKQTINVALSYNYFDTARRHLEDGFKVYPLGTPESGRLHRTEGILDIVEATHQKNANSGESLFVHAALSLMIGDYTTNQSTQETQEMTSESLRRGGYPYLAELYNYANDTESNPINYQMTKFPKIRALLLNKPENGSV